MFLVSAVILSFLFSYWLSHRLTQDGSRAQQMALHTLKMMANGGIRDHVGQVRGGAQAFLGEGGWRQRGGGSGWGQPPAPCLSWHRASTATPRTASGTSPTLRRCYMTRHSSRWPIHKPSR